mmetsp:Transcript_31091/g.65531  ORF Transcript_31091/g.65531 Transcript_31091/m.65531 type:complete len:317 (+) Transcript_31091:2952-3902(+)
MEDRQPALERVLPVLAHLGSFTFRHKDSVNVRPEHARDGVDHATDGVPRARDHLGRACVAVAVARADDALVVDKELRVVVALLRLGPLVPARRAEQPAEHHLCHLALHRHRVLVQVHAAAIFAKRHAQYHERVAVPLVAGYLGRPLAHVEPLAAPFHPHWRALMRAHDAAREVVEAGGARGARVHRAARPALAHPREVALQELRLEEAARALGRRRLRRVHTRAHLKTRPRPKLPSRPPPPRRRRGSTGLSGTGTPLRMATRDRVRTSPTSRPARAASSPQLCAGSTTRGGCSATPVRSALQTGSKGCCGSIWSGT